MALIIVNPSGLSEATFTSQSYSDAQDINLPAGNQLIAVALAAGSGSYAVNYSLLHSGAVSGQQVAIYAQLAASTNPTLRVYDDNVEGTLLFEAAGQSTAGLGDLRFAFDGEAWVQAGANLMFFDTGGGGGGGGESGALTDALAWWTLNESSGNRIDSTTHANTLTEDGTVTSDSGILGSSAVFDGTASLVNGSGFSGLSAFSVTAWIAGTISSGILAQIAQRTDTGTQNGNFRLIVVNGDLVWQIYNDAQSPSDRNVTGSFPLDGNFHHVVGTWDGTDMKLYLDGTLVDTLGCTVAMAAEQVVFRIGANEADSSITNYATGSVDEVGVYGFALTAGQVASLYNGGSGFNPFD
jgi:hypothetical protein